MSKNSSKRIFQVDLESLLRSDPSQDDNIENEIPKKEPAVCTTNKRPSKKAKMSNKTSIGNPAEGKPEEENDEMMDVTKFLENFGSDFSKSMKAKKTRLEQFTRAIGEVHQSKVALLLAKQEAELEELRKKFLGEVTNELEKWEEELKKFRDGEVKLLKMMQQHAKMVQETTNCQTQRLKTIGDAHTNFVKQFMELKIKQKNETISMKESACKESLELQKKFLTEIQKEEMTSMKKSLSSVFF